MAMARMRRACLASAVRAASARNCEILRSWRVISIADMLPAPRIIDVLHRVTFAAGWESHRSQVLRRLVLVAAAAEAEEVGHDSRAGVAGVVEAGQPERGFHRLQQREMRVVIRALHTLMAVVPIHDQRDLVRDWGVAVVVLVPHDHDRRLLP